MNNKNFRIDIEFWKCPWENQWIILWKGFGLNLGWSGKTGVNVTRLRHHNCPNWWRNVWVGDSHFEFFSVYCHVHSFLNRSHIFREYFSLKFTVRVWKKRGENIAVVWFVVQVSDIVYFVVFKWSIYAQIRTILSPDDVIGSRSQQAKGKLHWDDAPASSVGAEEQRSSLGSV